MKRYYVFAGTHYYPSGGFEDLIGGADTWEEAVAIADKHGEPDEDGFHRLRSMWQQIVDTVHTDVRTIKIFSRDRSYNNMTFGEWKERLAGEYVDWNYE